MVKLRKNNKKVSQTRPATFGDSSGMDGPSMQVESGSTSRDMVNPSTTKTLLFEPPIAKRLRKTPTPKPVSSIAVHNALLPYQTSQKEVLTWLGST